MLGNLEAAIAMAQRLEVYHGGDGAKAIRGGKGSKKYKIKIRKRVTWGTSKGVRLGDCPNCPSSQKIAAKERQRSLGLRWKKDQEGRTEACAMPQLWQRSFLHDCREWKEIKEKLHSSLGN